DLPQPLRDESPQAFRLQRPRAPVQAEHPGREPREIGVLRHEDAVLHPAGVAERALDPPGGVPRDLDPRLALKLADLPLLAPAVLVDRELCRDPEVALAPRSEADVGAD